MVWGLEGAEVLFDEGKGLIGARMKGVLWRFDGYVSRICEYRAVGVR